MTLVTVIQLQDDAPAGLLEPWARSRGVELAVLRADRDELLPATDEVQAAIVLGSERSANDETIPWIVALHGWLGAVLARGTPVLGICFGAQLMARALGGSVTRMTAPEVGWIEVDSEDPGVAGGPWLAWHEDGIGRGAGLAVIAGNARGIQAFRATGAAAQLGVQFHPEATGDIVRGWARADGGRELAAAGTSNRALERDTRTHAAAASKAADALFDGWLSALRPAPG